MHISDVVLLFDVAYDLQRNVQMSVCVELNLFAIRLLLAAVKDAELIVEQSPVLMSKCVV
jgi:hypothetical protein